MPISQPTTNHHEIRQWADLHRIVPAIVLPEVIDHEPTILRLLISAVAQSRADVRVLSWEEFFARFDELGLTLVYDKDSSDFNELLQQEEKSPYRSLVYRMPSLEN